MMRSDNFNWHGHSGYTEMNALSSNINVMNEEESKEIISHETLLANSSSDVSKSERNIVNKTVSQNNSAERSKNNITELEDKENKEPSVTQKVKVYLNIFECGRNLLDRLDVTYQQAFMATPSKNDYYNEMLKNLIKVKNEGGKLCNEKRR